MTMKKRCAVLALFVPVLTLCMIMPCLGAVPAGINSGVNFFNLQETQYRVNFEQRTAAGITLAQHTYYPTGERNIGGFSMQQVSDNALTLNNGQYVAFNVRIDDTHNDIFGNLNNTDFYYMSANIVLQNMSNNATYALNVDDIKINYYDSNNANEILSVNGTRGFYKFNYNRIAVIEFRALYTGETATYHGAQLRALTMYQRTPIYDGEGSNIYQAFVPYSEQYFVDQDLYNVGYDDGYVDGFNVGYGEGEEAGIEQGIAGQEPIKNWANFMINGVGGFLDIELFPGFPLWAMLAVVMAIPLVVSLLKIFAGG